MTPAEFKRIRFKLGLKQAELAKHLNVKEHQIRRYEAKPESNMNRKIPPEIAILMRALEKEDG